MAEQQNDENEILEDVGVNIEESTIEELEQKQEPGDNKKIQELENKLVRLQADFDNFRKRTVKEKEDIYKYAIEDFSKKMLPVLDNLERAISSIEEVEISDGYAQGVKMVLTQLVEVLKNEGLQEISTENTQFDPQCHHGVTTEAVEEVEDNHILEVYQKGYRFKEKVIRPAMVKICKK